jgi:hypothetical protein
MNAVVRGNMLWKLLTAGSLLVSMSCSAAACSEFYYEHCRYDQYLDTVIREASIGTGMKQAAGLGYMEVIGGWPCSESALSSCSNGQVE